MNDTQAERVALAVLELALTVRDEGPQAVLHAARAALKAAGGDPLAAMTVAAALVAVDRPVDAWWQSPEPQPEALTPAMGHGTHAAYARHRARGETACGPCLRAESAYSFARRQARKKAAA